VVAIPPHNPTWGCPQIAEQINLAFGTCINKDVVRRILALHNQPERDSDGPSWLTEKKNPGSALTAAVDMGGKLPVPAGRMQM
jgi:hypothetical protein